mmetsp:Transcript_17043/g.34492  ORF Transcript_17043/g.34492 Transcript_17043/m.34492 type:complete len:172 (-) Transcript_17043:278-793(-)|eukprot:CAMPEP_0174706412 /NCGR_PEP_ID=MMETSP1094-20130205/9265_1 /TAXON_ID=156173 /ORGANISM="Chrysochromulina brevifilum, Strain UTEX LB 985" /LENGTH=171 /DNA_ID=CAMNT_0015904669 /DNA_START=50 /DNA_END=565 /DNA_ORIENTATION=-
MFRTLLLVLAFSSAVCKGKEDPAECEVCKSVIDQIDKQLTQTERGDVELVEKRMRAFCDNAKGKEKQMCYYMGVGDAKEGTSGGVKREISSSLTRGINGKRLCTRLKKKDGQMCELKYEKKFDPKAADFKKMRVKELRKVCDDENINTKGFTEKDEYIKAIKTKFNIKDEM